MKRLLCIPFFVLLLSCSNSDDESPVDPIDPVENNTFVYDQSYEITELKYFIGPEGEELEGNETTLLKNEWSFYEDPGVLEITFKADSIQINMESNIYTYKYEIETTDLFIYQEDKKKLIGQVEDDYRKLYLFKKYLTYLVIPEKDNKEVVYEKSNDLGIVKPENIFPVVIDSPSDLTMEEEYILWSNISYKFIPEQ
jgi:hypothetical protein